VIKNFESFQKRYSKDPETFLKQVGIASHSLTEHSLFKVVKSQNEISESYLDYPLILDEGFSLKIETINEKAAHTYNYGESPNILDIVDKMSSSPYSPKVVDKIQDTRKKFRYPVIAIKGDSKEEYRTIGKLRASDVIYSKFLENPDAKTRFKILSFKGDPISVIEHINKFKLDVDINSFQFLNEVKEISKNVYETFGFDICNVEIVESLKGDILIRSIDKKIDLNPLQEAKIYQCVYEDYYQTRLPNWFKKKVLNEHFSKYIKDMSNHTNLIKSKHSLNYSKFK
jgi:hypothetical protein